MLQISNLVDFLTKQDILQSSQNHLENFYQIINLKYIFHMKKVKINRDSLPFCPASMSFGEEPMIIKLSMLQAMMFKGRFTSLEEMLNIYGAKKLLRSGENYKGYAVVFYACWEQDVVYLDGEIQKDDNGQYYVARDVCYRKGHGIFNKVYNFNKCDYVTWIKVLQLYDKMDQKINPEEFSKTLKEALVDAEINDQVLRLTDEQYLVLLSYDPKNFTKIFKMVND